MSGLRRKKTASGCTLVDGEERSARARMGPEDRVQGVGQKRVRVAITHIQCPDAGEEMAARAREALNCVWLNLSEAGPVVGSHVGPGTVGIAACPVGEDDF